MPRSRASGFFSFMDLDKDGTLDETEWGYLRAAMASQNGLLAIKGRGIAYGFFWFSVIQQTDSLVCRSQKRWSDADDRFWNVCRGFAGAAC